MKSSFFTIQSFLLITVLNFNLIHGDFAISAEPSMIEELRKTNPKDSSKLRDIKYRRFYKERIEKMNQIARSNREANLRIEKEDEAADKRAQTKDSSGTAPSSGPVTSSPKIKTPAPSGKSAKTRSTPVPPSSTPIKVDSNIPDELSFPAPAKAGSDSESDDE